MWESFGGWGTVVGGDRLGESVAQKGAVVLGLSISPRNGEILPRVLLWRLMH